jgi:hypothetical protein
MSAAKGSDMAIVHSDNPKQLEAAQASEGILQNDMGTARMNFLAAGGGPSAQPAYDAAVKAATIDHYNRLLSAARANGLDNAAVEFQTALRGLAPARSQEVASPISDAG